MKANRKLLAFIIFLAFTANILLSCSNKNDGIPEDESLTTYETLQAQGYETLSSVYNYDGQVTDGVLVLATEVVSPKCNNIGSPIKIRLFFQNRSNDPIVITSEFNVINGGFGAGGNLIAIIFDSKKNRIYTLADINLSSDTFYTRPNVYSTILPNSLEEFTIDYYFPDLIFRNKTDEVRSTPVSGQFLIRFVYSDRQRENSNWEGIVSSNLITVCIQ